MSSSEHCPAADNPRLVGDPVDTLTGAAIDRRLEFRLTGPLELWWYRHYDSSFCDRHFAFGRGQTHDFDRALAFGPQSLIYAAPLGRTQEFPLLANDGDQCIRHGYMLRRLSPVWYRLFHHGEPAQDFEFRTFDSPAPLRCLVRDDHSIEFHYDTDGHLSNIIDSCGRRIDVSVDEAGRITELALDRGDGEGPTLLMAYEYDDHGNLVSTRDDAGHGQRLAYDSEHRLIDRLGRKGFRFRFSYDAEGRCTISTGDDRLYGVAVKYLAPHRATQVTRPDRGVWTYLFGMNGMLAEVRDPLGGVQRFIADELNRPSLEVDPNQQTTRLVYDAAGAAVAKIGPTGQRVALPEDPNAPDPLARPTATNPFQYEYGQLLRMADLRLPDAAWVAAQASGIDRSLVVVRDLTLAPPQFEVTPLGPRWWPAPKQGRIFTDLGKLVAQYDELGRNRTWTYDASGNVERYIDFDGGEWHYDNGSWHVLLGFTNPLGNTVAMTYTTHADVASFTDAGGARTDYRYDRRDQLVEVVRHGRVRDRYLRDAAGKLIGKQAGDGRELLRIELGPGNLPVTRILASGDEHSLQYDKAGRCVAAATRTDRVQFAYDGIGRRTLEERNGIGVKVRYGGPDGPMRSLSFAKFRIDYEWDAASGLLRIVDPGGAAHEVRMLGHGISERRFANGSVETAQHDPLGRCVFKRARFSRDETWTRRYGWSGEGELREVEDDCFGDARHEYDAAHRLTARIRAGHSDFYSMDAADNLLEQPSLSGVALAPGNRLVAANDLQFTYNDRDHIELRRGPKATVRYEYDSRDQLVRAHLADGIWEAQYDALGRRVRKTWQGATTEFYWNDEQLIAEVRANGSVRLYVYADDTALTPLMFLDYAALDAAPSSCRRGYIFSDQLGTPRRIEDDAGREIWRADVEPFGTTRIAREASTQFNLRFPGHYADDELALHYNRYRYYDPLLGRYLQSDPWGLAGGFNLYAYRRNPLLESDPRGLGEEGDTPKKKACEDEEGTPKRQPISDREEAGGKPPKYALDNPDLYEYDSATSRYRRKPGEGRSRESEFPSGYRQDTHEEMILRHTDEGRAQGTGRPVDAHGDPIPRDELTWRDKRGKQIDYYDEDGNTNLTYDHKTSCAEMYNNGATTTAPDGTTRTYPPGNNTDRATRSDFYNDPDNLQPMPRPENSGKGSGGAKYNTNPTGPDYDN